MASRLRQDRLRKHAHATGTATSGRLAHASRSNGFGGGRVIGALLFALLAAAPTYWGLTPLPYALGGIAPADIRSRVAFTHADDQLRAEAEQAVREAQRNMYRQEKRDAWMGAVFRPVQEVVERAADAASPEALEAVAREQGVELGPEAARVLHQRAKDPGFESYREFIIPMGELLAEDLYPRGVLSDTRHDAEMEEWGREIEVVTESAGTPPRFILVAATNPRAPVRASETRAWMHAGFLAKHYVGLRDRPFLDAMVSLLENRMQPTLIHDQSLTEKTLRERIEATLETVGRVEAGELLIRRGRRIIASDLARLRAEEQAFRASRPLGARLASLAAKVLLLFTVLLGYLGGLQALRRLAGRGADGGATPTSRDGPILPTMALLGAVVVLATHVVNGWSLPAVLIPVGAVTALTALAQRRTAAILAATTCCLIVLILLEGELEPVLALLAGSWLLAALCRRVRHRLGVLQITLGSGLAAAGVVLAWGLAKGQTPAAPHDALALLDLTGGGGLTARATWTAVGFLGSGVLAMLALPLAQPLFHATTDIRLQELLDQDHPLLRRMITEAPGSYHHSIIVAALAEAAAETVDANPLLAKVGSLFHDVGKLTKPEYFTENQTGISRHDALKPSMSALIIIAHVKDGAELARHWGLPPAVVDMVEQHHGSTVVQYFYHRAKTQAGDASVDEAAFRYAGPPPRGREAALVMLADSVEAATRSLERASPARIRELVHTILMAKLTDHQLEDSGLTLTDLGRVEEVFVHILGSMFHTRVRYPGQEKEGGPSPRR